MSEAVQKIGEKLYSAAKEKEDTEKSAQGATPESGQGSDPVGEDTDKKSDESAEDVSSEKKDETVKEADEPIADKGSLGDEKE